MGHEANRVLVFGMAALGAAPGVLAQEWVPLQDGKSLAGWKAAERPESWVVEDGVFVSARRTLAPLLHWQGWQARFQELRVLRRRDDSPGANSGIYVHTEVAGPGWPEAGYEMQVINSNPPAEKMNGYIEYKMTGSIYAVRNTWRRREGQRVVQLPHPRGRQDHPDFHQRQADLRIRGARNAFRPTTRRAVVRLGHVRAAGARSRQRREVPQHEGEDPAERCRAACGLVPLADRELDQLVTQASNDNIPLIDLGLVAADGDAAFSSMRIVSA
jgi:hypothetical protein